MQLTQSMGSKTGSPNSKGVSNKRNENNHARYKELSIVRTEHQPYHNALFLSFPDLSKLKDSQLSLNYLKHERLCYIKLVSSEVQTLVQSNERNYIDGSD